MSSALPAKRDGSVAAPLHIFADELVPVFELVPDVVFFVKDRHARYTHVNRTLVQRLRMGNRYDVIGRRANEIHPAPFGDSYYQQDLLVLSGEIISSQLEMHTLQNSMPGWCLTHKRPIYDANGAVIGLFGISKDLRSPDRGTPVFGRLKKVVTHIRDHYDQPLRVGHLAKMGNMSVAQLERYFKQVFQLTPGQFLTQIRIEAALKMLAGDARIADIGLACGFTDQSAFSRQFRAVTGMAPRAYRKVAGT